MKSIVISAKMTVFPAIRKVAEVIHSFEGVDAEDKALILAGQYVKAGKMVCLDVHKHFSVENSGREA